MQRLRQRVQGRRRRAAPFGIVVRQFMNVIDDSTGHPWKNVYGFMVHEGRVQRLSPSANRMMQCTDPTTGLTIDDEPSVHYV